jgi:serine/threonine-protein kinase
MLTGKLPFEAETPWQWATQHMTAQPLPFEVTAPSAAIPPGMRAAILKALKKDREERHGSAREFFHELSEGARMTAEQPSRPDSTGTAAMAAAPDFRPAPLAVAATPAAAYGGATPPGVATNIHVPPPPARKQGGGKGLIVGLAALGGILLIAIVVVAARSMKPEPEDQPLANPFTSASGVATIAPVEPDQPPAADSAAPEASAAPADTADKKPVQPRPTSEKPAPKTSAQACDACISAASSGNIAAAAGNFARCTDPAKKADCRSKAKISAPNAARTAAFNGNCNQAKAIVRGAEAMGASSGPLTSAVATCK